MFAFGDPGVRKLLADIQIEEQNHAAVSYTHLDVYKRQSRMEKFSQDQAIQRRTGFFPSFFPQNLKEG